MNEQLKTLAEAVAITLIVMGVIVAVVSVWIQRIAQDCPDYEDWD